MERVLVSSKENLTEGKVQASIFISQCWFTNKNRALVLIQGSGDVKFGLWTRNDWIEDNLELGSIIPDIEFAIKNGVSVLAMNQIAQIIMME